MTTVLIDGVEYVKKEQKDSLKIENNIGATHYAILPDDSIVFYKLYCGVFVWLPLSQCWKEEYCGIVPYDLIRC